MPAVVANVLGSPPRPCRWPFRKAVYRIGVELVRRSYDDEPILEPAVRLEEAQGLFAGLG